MTGGVPPGLNLRSQARKQTTNPSSTEGDTHTGAGPSTAAATTGTVPVVPERTEVREAGDHLDRMDIDQAHDDASPPVGDSPRVNPAVHNAPATIQPTAADLSAVVTQPAFLSAIRGVLVNVAQEVLQVTHIRPPAAAPVAAPAAAPVAAPAAAPVPVAAPVLAPTAFPVAAPVDAHASHVHAKLSTRDVKLAPFSGSKDPEAMHVDHDMYLPLLEWVRESRLLLRSSGLSDTQKVFAIINALEGPARRSVMAETSDDEMHAMTPSHMFQKLLKCVPDHATYFSQRALSMSFRLKQLRKDVETFGLLVENGELNADGSHFWYKELVNRLLAAKKDFFSLAANYYRLDLQFREDERFSSLIARVVNIVTLLQQDNLLQGGLDGVRAPIAGDSNAANNKGANKRKNKADSGSSSKRTKGDGPTYTELAKEYSRCVKCGYYCEPSDMQKHVASCKGDNAKFNTRMRVVKSLVDKGKGDLVNKFGKKADQPKK